MQAGARAAAERIDQLVEDVGGPGSLLGRLGPHRFVELHEVAARVDHGIEFFRQDFGIGAAKGRFTRIKIGAFVDAEPREHMWAGDGLFDSRVGWGRGAGLRAPRSAQKLLARSV
jgi:hypothetical protein